jgi:magnesium transporter
MADRLKGGRAVNDSLKLPDNLFVPGQGDTPEYIDDKVLSHLCESEHPADLASQLSDLDLDQLVTIFSHMSPECCADVLTHMDYEDQREIAKELSNDVLALAITRMSSDDRVDLLQSMPEESSEILLRLLATTEREDIRRLSSYEEDTAGALMTSEYATLSPGLTARQAIDKLRLEAPNKETIYYSYVIDAQRRLLGLVSLRELILARPTVRIEKIMRRDPIFARVHDDQEEVARQMAKYDLLAMPVVNGTDALVGIITFDDVHDVIEEEATEDFHRMGSISSGTGADDLVDIGLRDATPWLLIRKRLPWLLALVFMNIFSGAGIAYYEDTIQATVALVFFLPLLIGSGGNAGAQSATLMVRALAIGDVMMKDWFRLLGSRHCPGHRVMHGVGRIVYRGFPGGDGCGRDRVHGHGVRGAVRQSFRHVPAVSAHPVKTGPGHGVRPFGDVCGGHRRGHHLFRHCHLVFRASPRRILTGKSQCADQPARPAASTEAKLKNQQPFLIHRRVGRFLPPR